MKKLNRSTGLRARAPLAMAVAVALLAAPAVQAFEFGSGEFTGNLDTTVSLGYSWRTEDQDPNLIGKAHYNPSLCLQNVQLGAVPPPTALVPVPRCTISTSFAGSPTQQTAIGRFSVNRDDGNLLYDEGDAISQAFKITSELDLKYKNFGAFMRASYFYDMENATRTDLSEAAKEKVGKDFRLLDAFIYGSFDLGEHKLNARVGRQVISWGESTFLQGGINVVNPIDVSKLRVAGAELKEAFLPVDALWASFGITDNLSMEGFYLTEFEQTEIDPSGTYFSQNDFAGTGGTYAMLGFGVVPQPVNNPDNYNATCNLTTGSFLNSDRFAELTQFYTQNPGLVPAAFQANPATAATNAAAFAIRFGCANSVPRLADKDVDEQGQFGFAVRYFSEALNQTDFAFYAMNYHSRLPIISGNALNLGAFLANPTAGPGRFASVFIEYPEDIQLYGMSFNTTLPGGVAWQGEISYRPNQPLQIDDTELLFAGFTPLNPNIALPGARFVSQLGNFSSGAYLQGYRRKEVSQLQMTFTKAFGQALGADQIALVGEIGATQVWDMEDPSVLRYEGDGTDTGGAYSGITPCNILDALATGPGGVLLPGCLRNPATTYDGFPTPFSWGYRIAARADYNSFMGTPITLSPRIAFSHDVNGISPGPGGNFLEGRKTLTIGAEANYLNKVVFDLSWTRLYGAGTLNQIGDRDFASFSVKYSF